MAERHRREIPTLCYDVHPQEYENCISCYRCVRVCAEQEGDYAISVKNRGFDTHITVEFDGILENSACTFCGQCIQTCPTGALGDLEATEYGRGGKSKGANGERAGAESPARSTVFTGCRDPRGCPYSSRSERAGSIPSTRRAGR